MKILVCLTLGCHWPRHIAQVGATVSTYGFLADGIPFSKHPL